ncbi:MAG: ATP-binding protein [Anaerolineae bacterium]|nr:ATP-binding protein [Anaerolineae bacterium]
MIPRQLDQITFADLEDLIENQVREGKTLEYKRDFPAGDDDGVKKFLAGVSAMANTSGGDFLIGVEAKDGVAVAVSGIPLANPDQEELRLENWLRTGLEPRLPRCDIRSIPTGTSGNYVIIVRVPQSWIAPHRVIHRGHDKFYGRNSAGKYPLDVSELRIAFNLSEQISDRIRNFRVERIAAVAGNEAPLPLMNKGKLLLHLIPLSAFTRRESLDIAECYQARTQGISHLPVFGNSRGEARLTLDGLLIYELCNPLVAERYTFLFRSGILEAVMTFHPNSEEESVPSEEYERDLLQTLPEYLRYLRGVNVEPPLYLFLTLTNLKGYQLAIAPDLAWDYALDATVKIAKNIIELPEVILETLDVADATPILLPLFDLIWNAFGHLRSFNFDQNGKWTGQRPKHNTNHEQ